MIRAEGGQVIPGGIRMPVYIILIKGWKIRPPLNCNSVEIKGNLVSDDDLSPFVRRTDGFEISIYEASLKEVKSLSKWYIISLALLALAGIIVISWIWNDRDQFEPYATFCLIAVTFIQIATQSRRD